jgi:hypothetical protein
MGSASSNSERGHGIMTTVGISQVVKLSAGKVFEHVLPLTGLSVVVSLFLLPPLFLLPLPVGLLYLALLGVPLAGVAVFASQRLMRREKWLGSPLKTWARRLPGMLGLGALYAVLGIILYSSWWYHFRHDVGLMNLSFYIALFQSYFVGMFFISQLYTLPLLFDEQEQRPVLRCVLLSMQTAFKRPGYAVSLFVQLLCVGVLLGFTVIGFFFLFPGIGGVLVSTAAKQVLQGDQDR